MRLLGCCAVAAASASALASCPPAGWTAASLRTLKNDGFRIATAERPAAALALADCLPGADPELRDDIAFTALSSWMRAGELTPATLQILRRRWLDAMQPQPADEAGFRRPFAALALAEVARVDRLMPFLGATERAELVAAAAAYLASVEDYRGFIPGDGWRHGVAHGADLLLQLALNPGVDAAAQRTLLAAVATQVMPDSHFYVFGEGGRLMRPVYAIARRKLLSAAEWSVWFAGLAARRRAAAPTLTALAADHDLATFLLPLYANLKESPDAELQALLLPGVLAAMKSLD